MQRLRPIIVSGASAGFGLAVAAALAGTGRAISIVREPPLPDLPDLRIYPPSPLNKRQRINVLKQADADRRAKQKAQRAARRRNRHV